MVNYTLLYIWLFCLYTAFVFTLGYNAGVHDTTVLQDRKKLEKMGIPSDAGML